MNAGTYRFVRIVISGLILVVCALVFADIGRSLSADQVRAILWPQFVPSLSALLSGGGWLATGCIMVILLTLIFGRVYCAMLCPLGVLMDFSAWLGRRTGKKRKLPYRRGHPWLRSAMIAVCVIGLIAGTAVPLAFLDPFSLFGKIIGGTLRPALATANELLVSISWVNPIKVSPVAWVMTAIALGLLILVVLTAVFRGRLWCNTVCPVGAVLGLFSKHAWFRLRIADSACIGCAICERVCPAQCIDFHNHTIDHSRCVMCLDCVTSCKRSGIHLMTGRLSKKVPIEEPDKNILLPTIPAASGSLQNPLVTSSAPLLTGSKAGANIFKRRDILTGMLALPAIALAGNEFEPTTHQNRRAVLPPGAGSLARFQKLCTACQLCVTNCPDQVLRPSITKHGLAGFLQPYQDFDVSFCSYNCSNCSQVCPTGALLPITVEDRRLVRTGMVEFIPDLCVVKTEGTACGACNEHCPTQAVHMVPWENGLTFPEIEPELCIGCGGCEFICPVRPHRAIIVNGLAAHERVEPLVLGNQNTVREIKEAFPF
jgi:polyferredoxin